jgi:hypothetical protein
MKKLYALLTAVILTASTFAQPPEKMSYQAVVRNASDNLVTNQSIGMQISILQGSASGTAVYVETQIQVTNANGLVSIEIGSGTVVTGDFATISWTNGPYFIKTETDPAGGTNYTITGTSQMLSVPYALHAKTAENVTGTITETDPVFGSSIASGITLTDTANWNNHTIDTDTQLDSTGVTTLGFVAGAHMVDTDTQLDSTGIANFGYVAGNHTVDTQIDSSGIATLGYVAGAHTVDTDTQLDSTGIAAFGFVTAGSTQIDSIGIANLGYVAGAHTVDTQLDSTAIANMGFVAGGGGAIHYVGELYGGGIVYYVDQTGNSGLIASLDDLDGGSGVEWSNVTNTEIGASAKNPYDGTGNTTAIIVQGGHTSSAAKLCDDYSIGVFSDWYLPGIVELRQMDDAILIINNVLANDGNGTTNPLNPDRVTPTLGKYWSSTEDSSNIAMFGSFSSGETNINTKNSTYRVRAVRAF